MALLRLASAAGQTRFAGGGVTFQTYLLNFTGLAERGSSFVVPALHTNRNVTPYIRLFQCHPVPPLPLGTPQPPNIVCTDELFIPPPTLTLKCFQGCELICRFGLSSSAHSLHASGDNNRNVGFSLCRFLLVFFFWYGIITELCFRSDAKPSPDCF